MRPDLHVEPYRPEDRSALYEICLRTGDLGADASADHDDPDVLGHVYVGPYLELEPDLAYVLRATGGAAPLGYVVATADTAAFAEACERAWWPPLRAHYRDHPPRRGSKDEELVHIIRTGTRSREPWLATYPAHLHINLLGPARGSGAGRALLTRLADELAARGVPGVHLVAASANTDALAFYRRLGFTVLGERPGEVLMGRALTGARAAS
ncbi:GNAT family N-acetyltransferase [Georgenia sp. MJ206]|uniref:GNAT family N-acetyltransferase n=1 Tax=Georgenia wangjunii TaxID=3117730 RepID=UPI002F26A710